MKITAWPLAALAFLVARDRNGAARPAAVARPSWLGIVGVMIPAVLPDRDREHSGLHRERRPVPARTGRGELASGEPAHRAPGGVVVPRDPPSLHCWRGCGRPLGAGLCPGQAATDEPGGAVAPHRVDHDRGHPAGPRHPGGIPPLSRGLLRVGVAVARRGQRRPPARGLGGRRQPVAVGASAADGHGAARGRWDTGDDPEPAGSDEWRSEGAATGRGADRSRVLSAARYAPGLSPGRTPSTAVA